MSYLFCTVKHGLLVKPLLSLLGVILTACLSPHHGGIHPPLLVVLPFDNLRILLLLLLPDHLHHVQVLLQLPLAVLLACTFHLHPLPVLLLVSDALLRTLSLHFLLDLGTDALHVHLFVEVLLGLHWVVGGGGI